MKKYITLCLCLVLLLTSCSQMTSAPEVNDESFKTPTWWEQYNLGIRYLSEGNYEEAIIAFTAAIEIDPKLAPAYVGRGDSHASVAQLTAEDTVELPKESITAYESAIADYLFAIDLDDQTAEVYLKAAEVYIVLGDTDAAIEILSQGYKVTKNESLRERMESLANSEEQSETVTVCETIIYNPDEYGDTWRPYINQYQTDDNTVICSIDSYGVRLETPIQVTIGGEAVSINEARLHFDGDLIDSETQLHNYETDTNGPLIGPILELQGYFYRNSQTQELEGPTYEAEEGVTYYRYRPNGNFVFFLEGYKTP